MASNNSSNFDSWTYDPNPKTYPGFLPPASDPLTSFRSHPYPWNLSSTPSTSLRDQLFKSYNYKPPTKEEIKEQEKRDKWKEDLLEHNEIGGKAPWNGDGVNGRRGKDGGGKEGDNGEKEQRTRVVLKVSIIVGVMFVLREWMSW